MSRRGKGVHKGPFTTREAGKEGALVTDIILDARTNAALTRVTSAVITEIDVQITVIGSRTHTGASLPGSSRVAPSSSITATVRINQASGRTRRL